MTRRELLERLLAAGTSGIFGPGWLRPASGASMAMPSEYGATVDPPRRIGDIGFAGFRVYAQPDFERDMFSFLGASYFRAVGGTRRSLGPGCRTAGGNSHP